MMMMVAISYPYLQVYPNDANQLPVSADESVLPMPAAECPLPRQCDHGLSSFICDVYPYRLPTFSIKTLSIHGGVWVIDHELVSSFEGSRCLDRIFMI